MTTGTDLRDQGVADVIAADTAPHRGYGDYCTNAIESLALTGIEFTAEDVRDLVTVVHPESEPHSPNVLPARMRVAAVQGVIRAIGFAQATRASRHSSVLRIWKGITA